MFLYTILVFQYKGHKSWDNLDVDVWELVETHGTKVNRYTLYIDHVNFHPVFYEMLGYNSLLGSHFDEYKLYYTIFAEDFPVDVFDIPSGMLTRFYTKSLLTTNIFVQKLDSILFIIL